MKCPNCGGSLGVVNTYQSDPIRRRRVCKSCGYVLYTCEVPEVSLIEEGLINGGIKKEEAVKQDGQKEA